MEGLKSFLMFFGQNSIFIVVAHQYLHINKFVEISVGFLIKIPEISSEDSVFILSVYRICPVVFPPGNISDIGFGLQHPGRSHWRYSLFCRVENKGAREIEIMPT